MAIPTGGLTVANLDAGTDRPDLARVELLAGIQKINEILAKLPLYADGEQSGTGTQRVGNLKIGSESMPAWPSEYRVADIGDRAAIIDTSDGRTIVVNNAFHNGTNWIAKITGPATFITFETNGNVTTSTAPSVAAGAVLTFTERFAISNTGAVTIGGSLARHNGNIFHGRVDSAGVAIRLPAGWTSLRNSAGSYTITHNLGTTAYSLTQSSSEVANVFVSSAIGNRTATTFVIAVFNVTPTAVDSGINFTLTLD